MLRQPPDEREVARDLGYRLFKKPEKRKHGLFCGTVHPLSVTIVTLFFRFTADICIVNSRLLIKYKIELAGVVIGGVAGFLYYAFIGCKSGTCAIASNPFISVPYGSLLGYFISGLFKKEKHENH